MFYPYVYSLELNPRPWCRKHHAQGSGAPKRRWKLPLSHSFFVVKRALVCMRLRISFVVFLVFVRRDVFEQDFMNLNEREGILDDLACVFAKSIVMSLWGVCGIWHRQGHRNKEMVSEMSWVFSSDIVACLCLSLYAHALVCHCHRAHQKRF